jgi:hypothetical protein
MLRRSLLLFLALLIVVATLILATAWPLGERVATHFGAAFLANGWMSRSGYLAFVLTFAVALPVVVAGAVGWLHRLAPRSLNIPNRDYWLASERRAATLDSVGAHACVLGCLLSVFMAGVHLLVLQANATVPPQLPAGPFLMLTAAFLAAFAVWLIAFWQRFRDASR